MATKRIGKNFLYNLLTMMTNILFPLMTFPYLARVLGPDGLGKVNFASAFVAYFVIFATIGIPSYGIREVAKAGNDLAKRGKVFSELFFINVISVMICTAVMGSTFFFIPQIQADVPLFLVSGLLLVFSLFSMEWVFSGMEDYKYISLRNLLVKMVYVIAVFTLVHDPKDYFVYACIGVAVNFGNYLYNILYLRKNVTLQFRGLNLKQHLKPIFTLFAISVSVSLYYTINPLIIGFLSSAEQVGYFTTFLRILLMVTALVNAYTSVVYPRFSLYVHQNQMEEYNVLATRSISLVNVILLPAMTLLFVYGREIIDLFAGQAFVDHVAIFLVMIPVLYFGGISQLMQSQILLPHKMERKVVVAPIVGAVINLGLGAVLIHFYGALGSSIAFVIAEVMVFFILRRVARKVVSFRLITKPIALNFLFNVLMGTGFYFLADLFNRSVVAVVLLSGVYLTIYVGVLVLLREPNLMALIGKVPWLKKFLRV